MEIKTPAMLTGYCVYKNLISTLLGAGLLLFGGIAVKFDLLTLGIAAFSGLSLFAGAFCGIYAMKSGTVSLCSVFGTAGMLIPILAGASCHSLHPH